jgi:hypothetical protein
MLIQKDHGKKEKHGPVGADQTKVLVFIVKNGRRRVCSMEKDTIDLGPTADGGRIR